MITTATIPPTIAASVSGLPTPVGVALFVRTSTGTAREESVCSHYFYDNYLIPDMPVEVEVCTEIRYSAPACRFEITTLLFVHGTETLPPSTLFLEEMMISYVIK